MILARWIQAAADWCTPAALKGDQDVAPRVRMFVVSHMLGPLLGHPISLYLFYLDRDRGPHLWVLAGAIAAFWALPLALKLLPRFYTALSLVSMQMLIFAILWGAFHYGGVHSPFLAWLLVVPLLAFFYLGSGWSARLCIPALMAGNLAVFYFYHLTDHPFPEHVPLADMVGIGIVSTVCAATYACAMALYYATIVDSQSELVREIARHRATMKQLVATKNEAEAANRAKTEFLATMSHELRTPLNAVIGFSEMMTTECYGPLGHPNYRTYAEDIARSGGHLLSVVNDILDVARIEAGTVKLHESVVSLPACIAAAQRLVAPRALAGKVELAIEAADDLPLLRADERSIKQVMVNLLSNAVKFTPAGGRVVARAWRDPSSGEVLLSVADTGIGMAAEELPKVLLPFYQVDRSLARKYEGAGLGLPLVKSMVELHQGTLRIESEPQRGTTVTCRFPAQRAVAAVMAAAE